LCRPSGADVIEKVIGKSVASVVQLLASFREKYLKLPVGYYIGVITETLERLNFSHKLVLIAEPTKQRQLCR
jgi:hypothetical protein